MPLPKYSRKIVTTKDLKSIIGPRPRKKSVIMCHGMFDIVHPGHLRHLSYAKEKADILVASLTADTHNQKANHRPYIPQDLRAQNLAALEMVDYVIVDSNQTPIDNILFLQPEYFAKGYEYFAEGLPPKTREEVSALESYGGEMVFTPGDVVYSSSHIIDQQPPNLGMEKLLSLMQFEDITFSKLRETLTKMKGVKVHVVGDTIVDSYSYCTLLGATAKSPTFSVKHDNTDVFVGGAAVVAKHIKAAGANVTFSTVLGDDERKDLVLKDLSEVGIECHAVVDHTRPTTHKERFIAGNYKMLQVDRVDNRPVTQRALREMVESIRQCQADIVVFSDFRHGIFNKATIRNLRECISPGALTVADSQVSNRWGNILEFTDFDLITPNEREARFSIADQDSTVRPLASELYRQARCKNLILKLGERGIIVCRSASEEPREFFTVDSFVKNLVDPIGAGDALLSYASLALRVTGNIVIASILGSIGATITCEHSGNRPVEQRMVADMIDTLEKTANFS